MTLSFDIWQSVILISVKAPNLCWRSMGCPVFINHQGLSIMRSVWETIGIFCRFSTDRCIEELIRRRTFPTFWTVASDWQFATFSDSAKHPTWIDVDHNAAPSIENSVGERSILSEHVNSNPRTSTLECNIERPTFLQEFVIAMFWEIQLKHLLSINRAMREYSKI